MYVHVKIVFFVCVCAYMCVHIKVVQDVEIKKQLMEERAMYMYADCTDPNCLTVQHCGAPVASWNTCS